MKLLFDQNLSPQLVEHLSDLYPGSEHVYRVGLDRAPDTELWDYARQNGFALVTQDADFSERSYRLGHPPKVIWIRLGNCSTARMESILRSRHPAIASFEHEAAANILTLL